MILSIWSWLGGLFWPALKFVFQCVICLLQQVVTADSAEGAVAKVRAAGWRGPLTGESPGWRCPGCGKL